MKSLESFNIRAAWRMVSDNKPRREPDGTWTHPSLEDVLEEVGMQTISHYVEVRRQKVVSFIVNWPIFDFCVKGEKGRGSSLRQFWWEQPMDLDEKRAAAPAAAVVVSSNESSMDSAALGL
ncbi:hypothetical protein ACHAXR_012338 [Thalassiosira sp. AJA248-18]